MSRKEITPEDWLKLQSKSMYDFVSNELEDVDCLANEVSASPEAGTQTKMQAASASVQSESDPVDND